MFKGKPTRVVITGDAKEEYEKLTGLVKDEKAKGETTSDNIKLLNSINQKIEFLKQNPQHGIHIPKDRIPKEYIKSYDVNNLWKEDLIGAWRMIYSIKGSEIEIVSIILDIIDHKRYEKKFGYKKS